MVKWLPSKISIHILKIMHNCLPTDSNIKRSGIALCSKCCCCTNPQVEDPTHLFNPVTWQLTCGPTLDPRGFLSMEPLLAGSFKTSSIPIRIILCMAYFPWLFLVMVYGKFGSPEIRQGMTINILLTRPSCTRFSIRLNKSALLHN